MGRNNGDRPGNRSNSISSASGNRSNRDNREGSGRNDMNIGGNSVDRSGNRDSRNAHSRSSRDSSRSRGDSSRSSRDSSRSRGDSSRSSRDNGRNSRNSSVGKSRRTSSKGDGNRIIQIQERRRDGKRKDTKKEDKNKFSVKMQKKLAVLYLMVLLAFSGLVFRLAWITREDGARYQKQVFSQQKYESTILPFRRGDIVDAKGTRLATSEKVYNLVIDAKVMTTEVKGQQIYLEPTLQALAEHFEQLDMNAIRQYVTTHRNSSYYVPLKQLTYEEISGFQEAMNNSGKTSAENTKQESGQTGGSGTGRTGSGNTSQIGRASCRERV